MELFEELARSMAGVEELTSVVSDRLLEANVLPHSLNAGPTDLGLDDIKDGPDTPKTPGVGLGGGGLIAAGERRMGGMTRSASKSQLKRGISCASLAAMDSLRAEPEIWQVCSDDMLLWLHSVGQLVLERYYGSAMATLWLNMPRTVIVLDISARSDCRDGAVVPFK